MSVQATLPPPPPAAGVPPGLPDVNTETYPFTLVEKLLDQAAYLDLVVVPVPGYAERATLTPRDPGDYFGINGGYGLAIESTIHRLASVVPPGRELVVSPAVGGAAGTLRGRWLFAPLGAPWAPGKEPPVTLFDPWRQQQFVLDETEIEVRGSSFRAYGLGRTYPTSIGGRPVLLAGAVGNVTATRGDFAGLEGTLVLNGSIDDLGFRGNVSVRFIDPTGQLRSDRDVAPVAAIPDPFPDRVFLVMRGQKKDPSVKTVYGPPPGPPGLVTLLTPAEKRTARYDFDDRGHGRLRTRMRTGQLIAHLTAAVSLDIVAPPGTAENPNPFTTLDTYVFVDENDRQIATLTADIQMGWAFDLKFPSAPGQPGMRYGGIGPIVDSSGLLAGAQGMLSINSAIGIEPHALSLLNILQLWDPDGRFRLAG